MSHLKYKGYLGTVEPQLAEGYLMGRLAFIKELVVYEGDTLLELTQAFHEAVNHYLADCKKRDVQPDQPAKGVFSIRIAPELHREALIKAADEEIGLNTLIRNAVYQYVHGQPADPSQRLR